jgi:hypothetical protein
MKYSRLLLAIYQYAYNVWDSEPKCSDHGPVHFKIADVYLWTNYNPDETKKKFAPIVYLYRN